MKARVRGPTAIESNTKSPLRAERALAQRVLLMSVTPKTVVFFMAFLALNLIKADTVMSQQNCDPRKSADAYIAKHFPSFDTSGSSPRVLEQDVVWKVTYDLPDGVLGGAPVVAIDKRTCRVVRAWHTQ